MGGSFGPQEDLFFLKALADIVPAENNSGFHNLFFNRTVKVLDTHNAEQVSNVGFRVVLKNFLGTFDIWFVPHATTSQSLEFPFHGLQSFRRSCPRVGWMERLGD